MSQAALTFEPSPGRLLGAIAVLGAGLAWSTGGLLVRGTVSDAWSVLIYRSLAVAACMALVISVRRRGQVLLAFRSLGWVAPVGGLCIATAMSCFVLAMTYTTVFNTVMMMSIGPMMAAGLGWLVMREPVRRATWFAIAAAVVGVAIMVWDGLATDSILGNLLGLLSITAFATFTVLARNSQVEDTTPCVLLAGVFGAVAALFMAIETGGAVWVGVNDLLLCLCMGFAQVGIGFVLYTYGAHRLPAAETTLLVQTEVIFGPVWVWLVFAERPTDPALLGGAILLGAVVYQAASGLRKRRPPVGML